MKFVDWHGIETECTHVIDYGDTDQTPETLLREYQDAVGQSILDFGKMELKKIDGVWWQRMYDGGWSKWAALDSSVIVLMEV